MKLIKKIFIVAQNKQKITKLKNKLKEFDFQFTKKDPDLIISFGGDGTYLTSERLFPGIPKFLIRDSRICNKCGKEQLDDVLQALQKGKYNIKIINKLETKINKTKFLCINDFILRNKNPSHAIRFNLYLNNKRINQEIIGDGLVVCTVFGSTGYYKSITGKKFSNGIGIAFNNSTKKMKHLVVKPQHIKIELLRYGALFAADNNPKIITLKPKNIINIKQSREKAILVCLDGNERKYIKK